MSYPFLRAADLAGVVPIARGVVVLVGDVLARLRDIADASVHCIVTSPPYLDARDYGVPATAWPEVTYRPRLDLPAVTVPAMTCCLGHEKMLVDYVGHLVLIARELRRVLRKDGTLWLNLAAGYSSGTTAPRKPSKTVSEHKPSSWETRCYEARVTAGFPAKQRIPTPSAVRDALQGDGWFVRDDIAWWKPNATPSSVRDRCTPSYESVFMLTREPRYTIHLDRLATPAKSTSSRNKKRQHGEARDDAGNHRGASVPWEGDTAHPRDVWVIPTARFKGAHFATFPEELARRCIVAGSDPGDVVLDPFAGSGTTLAEAAAHSRHAIGIDAQESYLPMMVERTEKRLNRPARPEKRPKRSPQAQKAATTRRHVQLDLLAAGGPSDA
jgi:DNA modification methylase